MNIAGTAFEEFEKLIQEEITQKGVSTRKDIPLMLVNLIFDGNAIEPIQFLKQYSLSESLFYVEQLHYTSKKEFDKIDWYALDDRRDNGPHYKLATLIWIACKVEYQKEIGYPEVKIAEFYKDLLAKYPYLVPLEELLYGVNMFCVQSLNIQWELFIYESILLASIEQHPQNFAIHAYLIKLYYENEKYEQALNLANIVVAEVKDQFNYSSDIGIHALDYLDVLQYRADILYRTEALDLTLEACNSIIDHLPFRTNENETRPFYELCSLTLVIRACINLKLKNEPALNKDIELLLKYDDLNRYRKDPTYRPLIDYIHSSYAK